MARKNIPAEVIGIRQLTPRIREYCLATLDRQPLPAYGPGAHIALHLANAEGQLIVRHYSLVGGADGQDDPAHTCRIAVQREDRARGSAHIHASFEVGTRLQISAPVNDFPLDRRDTRSLLIAGGIGITPIFSMVRSLARRRRDFQVVYAGRQAQQMAYREALLSLAGEKARIHCSDSAGRLDLHALLQEQPARTTVYICGPEAMVAAAHQAAADLGWSADRVRSELFGMGPRGNEVAFDVELRRTGRIIRVGRDASILDALTAANVPALWDCRRGECGLCPLPVLASDGPIEHRDRYLSAEERASGQTLCICVSRIAGSRLVLDA